MEAWGEGQQGRGRFQGRWRDWSQTFQPRVVILPCCGAAGSSIVFGLCWTQLLTNGSLLSTLWLLLFIKWEPLQEAAAPCTHYLWVTSDGGLVLGSLIPRLYSKGCKTPLYNSSSAFFFCYLAWDWYYFEIYFHLKEKYTFLGKIKKYIQTKTRKAIGDSNPWLFNSWITGDMAASFTLWIWPSLPVHFCVRSLSLVLNQN